ncbi:MAG: hypothetical protein WKF41_17175 [Gaiellaceae bacterium]
MDTDPRISFIVGKGGWTYVAWNGRKALVRFELNPDKKTWRLAEIRIEDPSSETLRTMPLSRIGHAAMASPLVAVGLAVGHKQKAPADVAAMFRGRDPEPQVRLRLERPKGRKLDTNFYKTVALAYLGALAEGLNPRQTLARDAGVSPDTVARWVSKARRPPLNLLPATEPGRVLPPPAHEQVSG